MNKASFSSLRFYAIAAAWLGLTGCALVTVEKNPATPFSDQTAYAAPVPTDRTGALSAPGYDDPALHALVDTALETNLTLAGARARMRQAEFITDEAGAALWPTIGGSGDYTQIVPLDGVSSGASRGTGIASFAPDFAGRRRAAARAARREAFAAVGDFELARLEIAHAVADAYYDAGEARRSLALIEAQIKSTESFAQLAEQRFAQGVGGASNALQQRELAASIRAQRPAAETALALAESRLDVLLGQVPDNAADGPDILPGAPPAAAAGAPLELIARRPDIAASRERLIAADYRVAEAIASAFPDIVLSATATGPSFQVGGGFQSANTIISAFVAEITQTVYEGGARRARRRQSRAAFDEALAAYADTWLSAIAAVHDDLVRDDRQRQQVELLEARENAARSAYEAAKMSYAFGAADFLNVLTAQQSLLTAESDTLTARRERLRLHGDLLESLGAYPDGTLIDTASLPTQSDAERAQS
ncbi:MAG: efflux transporter outer membrane subunit [Pseudomonadota bacterium]